jgi:hypothetical protein
MSDLYFCTSGRYNRDAEEEPVEEEDPTIEPYDVLLESGLLFRDQALYAGEDAKDAALEEGYDPEADDYEFADDPLVSLPGELVAGTVKTVEAGGLTVEFEHAGQNFTVMRGGMENVWIRELGWVWCCTQEQEKKSKCFCKGVQDALL